MTVDLGTPVGRTPAEPVMSLRVPRFVVAGAGASAVAAVVVGDRPVLRGLMGATLLVAVVAGAVAARRRGGAERPTWWLVAGGVTLTAVSVVLGSGDPPGAALWATAAGTAAVAAALLVRAAHQRGGLSGFGLAGLVGFVGVSVTVVGLFIQLGAFSGGVATGAADVVCLLAAGGLTMVATVRAATAADRLLLAGATVLVVSWPLLLVSPVWGYAFATVGGVLAALAPVWLDEPLVDSAGAADASVPSRRAWIVMAVAALAPSVSGFVMTWDDRDPRLLVVTASQLVLVVVLVIALLGLVRDRARHVGRVTELAETDPVTGLANRQRFQADVARALGGARETMNVTVMLVALENFTELRARLGEATAENLQVAAARRLVAQASDALAVGHLHTDVVALVFDIMNSDRAGARAQHFVDVLREPIELPQLSLSVRPVVGLATGQAGSADAAGLLASAELALAAARGPAGPLVRFTPELERRDAMAAQLVGELSEAIARGEVQAYFQPQLDLTTGKVTGAEALVRWLHPSLGLLNPAAFVPAAEVTGTIRMITVHVLDQALYWGARWARSGRPLNVSVNLSARDLLHARLVDDVREALARYSMPASRLELEITETMAMADVALSQQVLTDLARLGVTISIDDYGTGYGSLAYLQQLPVRRLKIDRSFVSRILDDEASMAIVRSTIELAGELGLDTVAEGVEDEATVQRLRAFGCGSVQGFGVAAPMSPEGFERAIWRLEHRPRPGVAAVRPALADHEAPAAKRAAFPSVAEAYHELHDDPGWWTGDPAQAPAARTGAVTAVPTPAQAAVPTPKSAVPAPVPPAVPTPRAVPAPTAGSPSGAAPPQVPQPVQGSPWSAPGGLRAPDTPPVPHSAPQPVAVQHRNGPARETVRKEVVQPPAVPAPRGWVPQRQRAVVAPDEWADWSTAPGGQAVRPAEPEGRPGWPAAPSSRDDWSTSTADQPDWPVAPGPDPGRPTRRELRRQRELGEPVTGAATVRRAATATETTGRDPA